MVDKDGVGLSVLAVGTAVGASKSKRSCRMVHPVAQVRVWLPCLLGRGLVAVPAEAHEVPMATDVVVAAADPIAGSIDGEGIPGSGNAVPIAAADQFAVAGVCEGILGAARDISCHFAVHGCPGVALPIGPV